MSTPSHTSSVLPSDSFFDNLSAEDKAEYDAYLDELDEKATTWGDATAAWS